MQETFEIQNHLYWGNNTQPSAETKSKPSWCFWVRGKCNWSDVPHISPPPKTLSKFSGSRKISTTAPAELPYAVLFTFEGNCWLLFILPHVRQNNPLSLYSIKLFNIPSFLAWFRRELFPGANLSCWGVENACSWLGLAAGWQQIGLSKAGGLGQQWKDVPNHQPKISPKPRGGNIFNSSPKKAKNICQRFRQYHS